MQHPGRAQLRVDRGVVIRAERAVVVAPDGAREKDAVAPRRLLLDVDADRRVLRERFAPCARRPARDRGDRNRRELLAAHSDALAILAWFVIAFRLGDRARLKLFLSDGYLRP